MATAEKVKTNLSTLRQTNPVIRKINGILCSPWGIAIMGALTVLAFIFSLELVLYTIIIIYAAYVGLFGDDFSPFMPLFILAYVAPSIKNNPGKSDQGLFYGSSGIYIGIIAVIAVIIIITRIATDKDMGFKKLFTMKRFFAASMLAVGGSYMLSGIGSEKYLDYVKGNLLFAFIQFMSLFLLYFIFSATVKWDKFNVEYFAWFGVIMGIVVALEVGWIYIAEDVIVDGTILRGRIYSGWGCYNNIGAIISMSIPFAFYLACRKEHNFLYTILGCFLFGAVILSCSRGSMVGGAFAFAVSYIYTFFKAENKKEFRITTLALVGMAVVAALLFHKEIITLFNAVPDIADGNAGSISFNDSGRFNLYKAGLKVFLDNPIFGQTFYPAAGSMPEFSDVEAFSSFFPPRWHNTVVQLLAACGAVGMLAYSYHRIETIRFYFKKRTVTNSYIAIAILTLLGMSLLDCHFFNVAPVFFYSMALAVMEFGQEKPIVRKEEASN